MRWLKLSISKGVPLGIDEGNRYYYYTITLSADKYRQMFSRFHNLKSVKIDFVVDLQKYKLMFDMVLNIKIPVKRRGFYYFDGYEDDDEMEIQRDPLEVYGFHLTTRKNGDDFIKCTSNWESFTVDKLKNFITESIDTIKQVCDDIDKTLRSKIEIEKEELEEKKKREEFEKNLSKDKEIFKSNHNKIKECLLDIIDLSSDYTLVESDFRLYYRFVIKGLKINGGDIKLTDILLKVFDSLAEVKPRIKDIVDANIDINININSLSLNIYLTGFEYQSTSVAHQHEDEGWEDDEGH